MTERFFNKATETMSRVDLERHQYEKLQRLLARIYDRNVFYTDKFNAAGIKPTDIRSIDDVVNLPITTKDELVAAQDADPPLGTNATHHKSEYVRFQMLGSCIRCGRHHTRRSDLLRLLVWPVYWVLVGCRRGQADGFHDDSQRRWRFFAAPKFDAAG
jgi:hypothetical protein